MTMRVQEQFRGVVDIYLEPRELQTSKPALSRVVFDGVTVLAGRKLLRFRKTDPEETWTLDPSRILAVRASATPPPAK